jgi:hypothetical protein
MNEQQIRLKLSRLPGDKLIRVAVEVLGCRGHDHKRGCG